jgi:hypothetical protein
MVGQKVCAFKFAYSFSCDRAAETVADEIVVPSRSETQRELLRNETRSVRAAELHPEFRIILFSFEEKRPAIPASSDKPSMTGALVLRPLIELLNFLTSFQKSLCLEWERVSPIFSYFMYSLCLLIDGLHICTCIVSLFSF